MRRFLPTLALVLLSLFAVTRAFADTCNGFTTNLVSNCSFETGSFSGWTGSATTAGANYAGVDTGDPFTTYPTPYAGRYEAYFGPPPASTLTLTQTLATTAGMNYLVEFALLNDTAVSPGYTNSFAVLFGGTSIFTQSALGAGPYTLYTATGTATSASTALSFISRNDGGYFELDSVSVTAATPEPSSLMLLGTAMLGCVEVVRRKLTASSR